MAIDMIKATHETFAPYVSQDFNVQSEAGDITFRLDNVKIFHGSTVRDNTLEIDGVFYPPRKAFALTWEGPRDPQLGPGTYVIENDQTGPMTLYVSPFRRDHDCMLYESVFN
ncbi:DUF6916 family protein [Phaeobacter marinintestinus]|uniref:DUF6916 family protein n=1 Tax=Falsiphaeobacter marinintestinus TaxID=1492905 RepID=UPI0011B67287|nr:hypothetical protein [Phaeobacter marinintestinus]